MLRHFDEDLRDLKGLILSMGGYVEQAIEEATESLLKRDLSRIQNVFQCEEKIDQSHVRVDEVCMELLARQSPMAKDLRMILAIIKINTDLERMGDQACNIAQNARHYMEGPSVKPLVDLPSMARDVQQMVRDTLDAFVRDDVELARKVLLRDDAVDAMKKKIFQDLIAHMQKDPSTIGQAMNLILIARNMERLGDHATNIAEDVIFAITGKDIRHQAGT